MKYILTYSSLRNFICAVLHFFEGTPNRWKYVREYIERLRKTDKEYQDHLKVILGDRKAKEVNIELFDENTCEKLYTIVKNDNPELLEKNFHWDIFYREQGNSKDGFKCIIFKSPCTHCVLCKSKLTPISSPSFPFVFTETGSYIAASYTSECRICMYKPRYNVSYYTTTEDDRGKRNYMNVGNTDYFFSTSQTCFSKRYLDLCSKQIQYMVASFKSIAEVYNDHHNGNNEYHLKQLSNFQRGKQVLTQGVLNPQRLEEA